MAAEKKSDDLEGRIDRLERMLVRPQREPVDISTDEVNAYIKVRDVLAADYGDFCGINDCFRCVTICRQQVCRLCQVVCRVCDVECVCGPCNLGSSGGGIRDFTQFGG